MITPYRAVDFKRHDIITRDILDTLQANNQWLKDNTPKAATLEGTGETTDLSVIVSGRVTFRRNKKQGSQTTAVRLGAFFDPNCRPNVTTGIVSDKANQIFCVVNGPSGKLLPTATGFDVSVHADDASNNATKAAQRWKIARGFFVYWQASGYRRDNGISI